MASYGERRRHHRVAARQNKDVYKISKKESRNYTMLAIAFTIIVFIKGLIIGYFVGKE